MLSIAYTVLICALFLVLAWLLYNLPILAVGFRNLQQSRKKSSEKFSNRKILPTFSIIVPVRNEEKVIGRLLDALLRLNYPKNKMEIIVVEDGSTDKTLDICMEYSKEHDGNLKILQKPFSDGKPSALNYGIKHAKGEIVGIFDADNLPDPNILINVGKYFKDEKVAAVQGRTLSINSDENMLTKFISYEEAVWCETYLRGKDVLDLFVHLKGSCQFLRRNVLEKIKGFDEKALSEDMEISARLTQKGYKIRYASDVYAWQENPADLRQLFRQRVRWFRGTMEVAFKYGMLMTKLNKKNIDTEITVFGPFLLITSIITYLAGFGAFFSIFPFDAFWGVLMQLMTITSTLTIFICGLALAYISKPRRVTNLLWLPFIYFYWILQAFIAFYAASLIILRRPKKWVKTEKTGKTCGFQ
ncbi:MAG: glycosyltransferase family 2 protein [Candidatus Bathyarchaeota archaeon]|nr:glycosyltransferase family 2 protein [Candidatus Bathyarchaeota archaeon]